MGGHHPKGDFKTAYTTRKSGSERLATLASIDIALGIDRLAVFDNFKVNVWAS